MKQLLTGFLVLTFLLPFGGVARAEEGPTISTVTPLQAYYTVEETFWVTASDPDGVASCTLVVSSIYETDMSYNATHDRWETPYTFTTIRSANSIRARCADTLGNEVLGPTKLIEVDEVPMEDPDGEGDAEGEGDPGDSEVDATGFDRTTVIAASPVLIKTPCPGGEDFTHPCRTVYFLDNEGVRHAFPNEKAYFTWYSDFDGIYVISQENMASFTLGRNVRYRPGSRLVKFPSVNTVYAVGMWGNLRAIGSEAVASSVYGPDWNTQVDDISEAFYGNYTFIGDALESADDPFFANDYSNVLSINDNNSEFGGWPE